MIVAANILDKSTFKGLFDDHYRPLCNVAFRISGDLDQAEDIVQDVFLKIWNQQDLLNVDQNIKSYMYTMVRNHALEIIRRQQIGARITDEILYLHTAANSDAIDDNEIEKYLILDRIYISIRQLPPKCAQVFTMAKVNGLSYSQIADNMHISVKTVENQMGKALRLLRAMLNNKITLILLFLTGLIP